jgi:hypothetical protein
LRCAQVMGNYTALGEASPAAVSPVRVRVDRLWCQVARTASTHARTRSTSRRAQIIQLERARLERGRRPPAMQNWAARAHVEVTVRDTCGRCRHVPGGVTRL